MAYARFDFSNCQFEDEVMTFEEALKDVKPMDIPEDVISGKRRMSLSNLTFNKENKTIGASVKYV